VKKILIFGGNRFVGKSLSKILLDKGYEVDVFNRSGTSADVNISAIRGDRNNVEDIDKIDFKKYDCVVDMCLFFISQFDLIYKLMFKYTNYIFVSSGAADHRYIEYYGEYGKEKLKIEEFLLDHADLNYQIVRPSYIVGENDHRARLDYYIDGVKNRKQIKIDGDGTNEINMVFVQDVVKVLEKLVDKDELDNDTLTVCGNDSFSLLDLIKNVNEKYYQKKLNLVFNQEDAIIPKNTFVFDNTQTCIKLDMMFTDFYKGFKDYMEWYEISKS
jgi:nucleoside-diphosphate-sugar epimerase